MENIKICSREIDFTASGVANITCPQPLFGDWVGINKTTFFDRYEHLILAEVRVFGGKCSSAFMTPSNELATVLNSMLKMTVHYNDVTMGKMASQITSLAIVYSAVYSGADQRKHQKLRVTGLCAGNSPETGEFPAQMASNAENVTIWWRHHELIYT